MQRVLHLGGNGHATARLGPARAALAARNDPFDLIDTPYPGFEGRERAPSFDAFLGAIEVHAARCAPDIVHASGIGGLFAIALRARGALRDTPIVLQGPVLWGLERRRFPRVMRFAPARAAARVLFGTAAFRRHFVARHFEHAPSAAFVRDFFAGYTQCLAFEDLFAWCTSALLRDLEARFAADPAALRDVTAWWGRRDRVVTPDELRVTEAALGVSIALREFPAWGHYPMIDDPDGWVEALADALA